MHVQHRGAPEPSAEAAQIPAGVTVLGATGSIGASALDVLGRHTGRYRVVALTAHRGVEAMAELCRHHRPEWAVMADEGAAHRLHSMLRRQGLTTQVLSGVTGLETVSALPQVHLVVAAIVGAAGLRPALAAARAGKRVLLANKEALVMSGRLFMDEVARSGSVLLPLDSEHNAVFQCLPADFGRGLDSVGVRRIWLTASGGPFRTLPVEEMVRVTPQQACAHPNWVMGPKISVDSATMMNKGLEVIEACWLFATTADRIQVVLHPQSMVHSVVEYRDGSFLAQLGAPDMRIPIAHALAWPERIESGAPRLDLTNLAQLNFEAPDPGRYPCLGLAYQAMAAGGTAPALLNAANEVAVEAFLAGRLNFPGIAEVVSATLAALPVQEAPDLDVVLAQDEAARSYAAEYVVRRERRISNE